MTLPIGNTPLLQLRDTYTGIKNPFDVPKVSLIQRFHCMYVYLSSESNEFLHINGGRGWGDILLSSQLLHFSSKVLNYSPVLLYLCLQRRFISCHLQ